MYKTGHSVYSIAKHFYVTRTVIQKLITKSSIVITIENDRIEKHIKKLGTSRFAIAQKRSDLKKTIIVQLVYVFRHGNKKKKNNLISNYSIEIKSINGLVNYRIQGIRNGGKVIVFLYGSILYVVDLRKSLFDFYVK